MPAERCFWRRWASLHHPKALILLRHLEEIAEPLPEDLGPVPAGGDPTDANTLVGRRKALEVFPGCRVCLQFPENIGGKLRRPLSGVLDCGQARFGHPAGPDQPPHTLAIHVGQPAGLLSRRVALRVLVLVDGLQEAVDPAVAQRLVDSIVVGDAWLAAHLLIVDQPDLAG